MKKMMKTMMLATAGIASLSLLVTSCYKEFDPESYAPPLNIGGFTSTKEIAPANLVAWFSFDGNLLDSVSSTAGTNTGTGFTNGVKGQAMQGADQSYVLWDPTTAVKNMTAFTITYWVNSPVNTAGIAGLVNLSNTTGFWGNIDMFFENGSTATAAKFRAHITNKGGTPDHWIAKDGLPGIFNNWVNFAVSYDGVNTFRFYVNGALIVTDVDNNFGALQFLNSGKVVFGTVHFQTTPSQTTGSGSQPWASFLMGGLDEVRIYNKALTDNEVNSLVKLEGRGK
jgi:hypothetical protein